MFHAAGPGSNVFYEKSPPAHSYNAVLGSAGLPLYLLDLRTPPNGAVRQWLDGPQDFHKIGGGYDPARPTADDVTVALGSYFDLIIAVQQTTASHLIPLNY